MASSYPTGLDTFSTARSDSTVMATTHKDDTNNANDAINKIEAELGIAPSGAAATVVARLAELATLVPETTQSGTTDTLALADAGTVVAYTNAAAVTVTVPPNSSVAFPVGSIVNLRQYGAGQVTITQGAGVTIRPANNRKTTAQYSTVSLHKRATDEWVLAGEHSA